MTKNLKTLMRQEGYIFKKENKMYLWRVTYIVKKDWMEKFIELQWAVIADTSDGAIAQISDKFDLTGIIVKKAIAIKENIIVIK